MEDKTQLPSANSAFAEVTQQQVDSWKAQYKTIYSITLSVDDNAPVIGYFKKAGREVAGHCITLIGENKLHEAMEFLLNNTFIGGDEQIIIDPDISFSAQMKLWPLANFLKAKAVKY